MTKLCGVTGSFKKKLPAMLSNVMKSRYLGKNAKASRLNAKEKPGGTGTVPKDPHFLSMKNKEKRSHFSLFCLALELSLGCF